MVTAFHGSAARGPHRSSPAGASCCCRPGAMTWYSASAPSEWTSSRAACLPGGVLAERDVDCGLAYDCDAAGRQFWSSRIILSHTERRQLRTRGNPTVDVGGGCGELRRAQR
eukprot:4035707-Prymnesium_polylepis.1